MSKQTASEQALINKAAARAIDRYILSRRRKVPAFVQQHFSFKGSRALHQKALGRDLYRAPLNIVWAVPYAFSGLLARGLNAAGRKNMADALKKLPKGFETNVQQEVKWWVYTELLELPCSMQDRVSKHDALLNEILAQPEIQEIVSFALSRIHKKSLNPNYLPILEDKIREYTSSRTAAEDLSGSIITLAVGYAAFHQVSPGPVTAGASLAAAVSHQTAISNFWLGSTVGSWYYGVFPVLPSRHVFLLSTASIMAVLAVVTTFSGILTDPLQAKLGIHQKRLNRLIDSLEGELKGAPSKHYRAKEQYLARVFDIIDLLRTAARV